MAALNDCMFANAGASGALNDRMIQYFQANGATSSAYNDAERQFLLAQGVAESTNNDMWMEFLAGRGYTGSLNDRLYQFWCIDGGAIGADVVWEAITTIADGSIALQNKGVGTAATDHTAEIYAKDYQGVYRKFPSNAPVYEGSRNTIVGGEVTAAYGTGDSGEALDYWLQCQPAMTNHLYPSRPHLYDDGTVKYQHSPGTSVTENYGIAPDGTNTSLLVECLDNAGNNFEWHNLVYNPGDGAVTGSIWVKGTAGEKIYFSPNTSVATASEIAQIVFTGEWQQVFSTVAAVGGGSKHFAVERWGRDGLPALPAVTFETWQWEWHNDVDIATLIGGGPIFTDTTPVSTDAIVPRFDEDNIVLNQDMGALYIEYKPTNDYTAYTGANNSLLGMSPDYGTLVSARGGVAGTFATFDSGANNSLLSNLHVAGAALSLAAIWSVADNKLTINVNGAYGAAVAYAGSFINPDNVIGLLAPLGFVGGFRGIQLARGEDLTQLHEWVDARMLAAFTLVDDNGTVLTDDDGEVLVHDDYLGATI